MFEPLEARVVLDARLLITELVAENDVGLVDEDGDRTDWIEIYNAGDQSSDLNGWYLTDDADDKTKWSFPPIVLDAGDYLVVHASGKNRVDPSGRLHTNFQLRAGGEYLGLIEPNGKVIAHEIAPAYPQQQPDTSFGLSQAIINSVLVESGDAAKWLVPSRENGGNLLDLAWTHPDFDDVAWSDGVSNVGFDKRSDYDVLIGTDLGQEMASSATAYVRIPFAFEASHVVSSLVLSAQYDDGYVAYLNGVEVARSHAPENPVWNSAADGTRPDSLSVVFEDFDITAQGGLLRDGQNMLAIHAMNTNVSSDDFLFVPRLTARLLDDVRSLEYGYIALPTPGAPNGDQAFAGFVNPVEIDTEHGFYNQPVDVRITSDTVGASIIYTTDGSAPAANNGIVVPPSSSETSADATLHVERTTTIRVAAFKDDYLPSKAKTLTLIFADDVASQSAQATLEAGFPGQWGAATPDYGIDPNVVGPNDRFGGIYTSQFVDSLKAVPTLSIVMDLDDLFDAETGIYANPSESGRAWERPASVELIQPDGTPGFQIDAGIRVYGGASRNGSNKKSLRLEFRGEYGATKLRYPIFGDGANDKFDRLMLRAGYNDSWIVTAGSTHYIRDQWTRNTQRLMGHPSSHGEYMHLYINGHYWGLYNPSERPDATFSSAYYGGREDEWDTRNTDGVVDGTDAAWVEMVQLLRDVRNGDASTSKSALLRILGKLPDGTDNPIEGPLLNVESYIDYMLLNFYIGNTDWPAKNYYVGRRRGPDSDGFNFYVWDAERSLNDEQGAHVNVDLTGVADGVALPYSILRKNEEFQLMFADRVQRHFFNGGVLYVDPDNPQWDPAHPERNAPAARYSELARQIELPLVAESARWGDARRTELAYTIGDWHELLDEMFSSWLPQRSEIVLKQLIARGVFPDLAAPIFSQHGGLVDKDFSLTVDAPGQVYYTLDGTDPRRSVLEPGVTESGVSDLALLYATPITFDRHTIVKARTYADGVWSALTEASFRIAVSPLRVSEIMYHPRPASASELYEDDDFEYVELVNTSQDQTVDLAGVAFTGGIEFMFPDMSIEPGEYVVVVRNQAAFEQRYGSAPRLAGQYGVSPESPQLSNGGETIRLEDAWGGLIQEFGYDDAWVPSSDGEGFSLTVRDVHAEMSRWNAGDGWRSSMAIDGSPGFDDSMDFNADGRIDAFDLDAYCGATLANDVRFDVTGDGRLDQDDWQFLVVDMFESTYGDANLDGEFDSADLLMVLESGEYEDGIAANSTWVEGDWNCDAEFSSEDLMLALSFSNIVGRLMASRDVAQLVTTHASMAIATIESDQYVAQDRRERETGLIRPESATLRLMAPVAAQTTDSLFAVESDEWSQPSQSTLEELADDFALRRATLRDESQMPSDLPSV